MCAGVGFFRWAVGFGLRTGNCLVEGDRGACAFERDVLAGDQWCLTDVLRHQLPQRDQELRQPAHSKRTRADSRPALGCSRHREGHWTQANAQPGSLARVLEAGSECVQGQLLGRVRPVQRAVPRQ